MARLKNATIEKMSKVQDMITIYVQQVSKEKHSTICEKLIERRWDPLSIRTRK